MDKKGNPDNVDESDNLGKENSARFPEDSDSPKPATENMETHAHHLHKTPGHGWKHYLFEFFMLFLAVTLGFFVENWRDHYVENKRERQFITTLVEDLKLDTTQLTGDILLEKNREAMIDSLIFLLTLKDRSGHGGDIYYFARNISRPSLFFPNDRTILQLKNSGLLRIIRNLDVSDGIMYYDQQLRNLQFAIDDENRMRDGLRDKAGKIFDGSVFNKMFDNLGDGGSIGYSR